MTTVCLLMGSFIFGCGVLGFLTRRNLILMFLSLELMLFGVSLNFVAFGNHHDDLGGQVFAILILTTAACEAALALAVIVALYRSCESLDVNVWRSLGESEPEPVKRDVELRQPLDGPEPADGSDHHFPKLTPAGRDPLTHPVRLDPTSPNPASMA